MARTKKVAENEQKGTKTSVSKAPKHATNTFLNKYAEMLEDVVMNNHVQMIDTIANRPEFVETHQIHSVVNYRNEMTAYINKYGYNMMNEFCKAYRKRKAEIKKDGE